MNKRVRLVAVLVSFVAAACTHPEATPSPGARGELVPIVRLRAEPYSFAYYSGLDKPERIVVRDPDSWQALWVRINGTLLPVPPAPAVDFSREMLVVVALGARSTGGYGILVDAANESDNAGIAVTVRSISPKNCITTQAFTQPIDIARLARRDGPVSFIEHSEVHVCQ